MESLIKRIGRHIATGQVGPNTVIRGASALAEWAKSYDIQKSNLTTAGVKLTGLKTGASLMTCVCAADHQGIF